MWTKYPLQAEHNANLCSELYKIEGLEMCP